MMLVLIINKYNYVILDIVLNNSDLNKNDNNFYFYCSIQYSSPILSLLINGRVCLNSMKLKRIKEFPSRCRR